MRVMASFITAVWVLAMLIWSPTIIRAEDDNLYLNPNVEVNAVPDLWRCFYDSQIFSHGDVILCLPLNCLQLVCRAGRIHTVYYDQPGQCGCCKYGGKIYKSGERVKDICTDLTCKEGQWVSRGYIDKCCRRCQVYDDPHFISYDGVAFDFHGLCNYTITQEGFGYNSPYGVYGDFRNCRTTASCLGKTTFKDNMFAVITINYPSTTTISVNSNVPTHTVTPAIQTLASSVLAWQIGNCIRFLGSQGLMMDYCWAGQYRSMCLWAYPSLSNKLNGLCGHFNFIRDDDLTHRNGIVTPPPTSSWYQPNPFGNSWKTADQTNLVCNTFIAQDGQILQSSRSKRQADNSTDVDEGDCPPEMFDTFLQECLALLGSVSYDGHLPCQETLDISAASCASDLCAFAQDNVSEDETRKFKMAMQEMLETTIKNNVMTTPGAMPPNEGDDDADGDDRGDDFGDGGGDGNDGNDGGDEDRDVGHDGSKGDGQIQINQNVEVNVNN